ESRCRTRTTHDEAGNGRVTVDVGVVARSRQQLVTRRVRGERRVGTRGLVVHVLAEKILPRRVRGDRSGRGGRIGGRVGEAVGGEREGREALVERNVDQAI